MNWIENIILNSGVVQAQVKKIIAWAATAASVAVISLLTHGLTHFGFDAHDATLAADVQNIGGEVAAVVTLLLTLLWHLKDAKRVGTAIAASAQAGEVVTTAQAAQLIKGRVVALPSGQTITIGQITPKEIPEDQATAALNKAQKPG